MGRPGLLMLKLFKNNVTFYSGASDIRTPDNRTLQFTDDFIWERIFYTLFCLIYPEFRVPDPDGLFLPQNTDLLLILLHLTGR